VSICCCRHSSLQNGVSPLHAQINQEPKFRCHLHRLQTASFYIIKMCIGPAGYLYMNISLFPASMREHRKQVSR
jgi:hypothetical protein